VTVDFRCFAVVLCVSEYELKGVVRETNNAATSTPLMQAKHAAGEHC
jgi:hypothetical protein